MRSLKLFLRLKTSEIRLSRSVLTWLTIIRLVSSQLKSVRSTLNLPIRRRKERLSSKVMTSLARNHCHLWSGHYLEGSEGFWCFCRSASEGLRHYHWKNIVVAWRSIIIVIKELQESHFLEESIEKSTHLCAELGKKFIRVVSVE